MKVLVFLSLLFSLPAFAVQGNSCVITTQTDFGVTTTSTRALPIRPYRKCLILQNQSSSTLYVKFTSAHTGSENLTIPANTTWQPIIIPINAIYLKSAAGGFTTTVLEGQ